MLNLGSSEAHSLVHESDPSVRSQPQPESEAASSVTPPSQVTEAMATNSSSLMPASDCSIVVNDNLTSTEISSAEISGKDNHTHTAFQLNYKICILNLGSEAHSLVHEAHPRPRSQSQPESEATSSVTPSSQVIEMTGSSVASSVPASDCSTNVSHELTVGPEISSTEISGKRVIRQPRTYCFSVKTINMYA